LYARIDWHFPESRSFQEAKYQAIRVRSIYRYEMATCQRTETDSSTFKSDEKPEQASLDGKKTMRIKIIVIPLN